MVQQETPNRKTSHTQKMADMLTNGSFTRHKWDHLLRLFKMLNFSMFLAAIFVGTQIRASCRRQLKQDSPNKNAPAVAKARPSCLISRNLLSTKQTTSIDSRALQRIKSWVKIVSGRPHGNLRDTVSQDQQRASAHVETCAIPREPTLIGSRFEYHNPQSLRFFVH